MKRVITALLAVCCLFMSGCRAEELQQFLIVTAIGVDKEKDDYKVTFEAVKGQAENAESIEPLLKKGEGVTLPRCLQNVQETSGQYPYLRHASILVVSESAADDSLEHLFGYIRNEHNIMLNTRLLLCEGEAADVFNDDSFLSTRIMKASTTGSETMATADLMVKDFLYDLYADGIDAFIPLTSKEKTGGVAFLRDFSIAGKLEPRLTPAFLIVRNLANSGEIGVSGEGGFYSFRLLDSKSTLKTVISGEKAVISVSVKASFRAEDVLYGDLSVYEKALKSRLESDIREVADIMKTCRSDVFGAGQYLYRYKTDEWEKVKENWADIFANSIFDVKVDASIKSTGKIKEEQR
ncbi:MAG: Ger(x)C family spore germination protein [Clostridiaceae bacterium]|nr:Ger(x)C family spore germination protein [Clostridiaceae bacterium]